MSLHPSLFDECRVVRAHGELDLTTSPGFARDLEGARRDTGRLFLIVDLSGVTFMDGSALDPLCAAWDDCRSRHGWTRVVYARSCIGLLFWAGAVVERFPRYASAQDAWRGVPADGGEQWNATADRSA
ncbi:STAS domain-containing protein [Streptomyces sp. NBC_00878]|uniref:STAS domain-containing protein n=1 Tax=Streptomyces sp. NBC_00878 TaxID=2975854 RepID=UPI0022546018|nr:STAS domain-containing protein [Streptomyces sp. NBC_00878]MCX4907327.1 STAS domain-containing protein [Streptomyces sp. NBC_00878]